MFPWRLAPWLRFRPEVMLITLADEVTHRVTGARGARTGPILSVLDASQMAWAMARTLVESHPLMGVLQEELSLQLLGRKCYLLPYVFAWLSQWQLLPCLRMQLLPIVSRAWLTRAPPAHRRVIVA